MSKFKCNKDIMKKCSKCKTEKDKNSFYIDKHKKDGLTSSCIYCCRKTGKKSILKNIDSVRERSNKYNKKNREKINSYLNEKYKNDDLHRFKILVRRKTNYYIKNNKINKLPCEVCGDKKSEAHHNDYNNFLDITFLCNKHHNEWHINNNAILPSWYNEEKNLKTK